MPRIDYAETIRRVELPERIWRWLDLLGDAIGATQEVGLRHENYVADTPYKKLLVISGNKQIANLNAILYLLRCEMIHQAAAHVRLFCEGLITVTFIARDPETRATRFWGYSDIDAFNVASAMLEAVKGSGHRDAIAGLERFLGTARPKYESLKPSYTFIDKRRRPRPFSNWCNMSVRQQAEECGSEMEALYRLVYTQMSAYVHGSAWSLRRQLAYSRAHYDEDVVHNDVATVVRTALGVWLEWARFCDGELQ
jgi:hypothetical protein